MLSTRDVLLVELRAVPCGASDERWRERLNNGVTVWSPGLLVGVRRRFLDQLEWSDDPVRSTVRRSAHHDERHSARIVRPPARYRESCFAQQASVRGHPLCAAAPQLGSAGRIRSTLADASRLVLWAAGPTHEVCPHAYRQIRDSPRRTASHALGDFRVGAGWVPARGDQLRRLPDDSCLILPPGARRSQPQPISARATARSRRTGGDVVFCSLPPILPPKAIFTPSKVAICRKNASTATGIRT